MLEPHVENKLESISNLPTIPVIISQVLDMIDNDGANAALLSSIIEQDQTLTAHVLKVANSPFYGFARKIATIELAIVVLGMNEIKDIVYSLVVRRLFTKVSKSVFDVNNFWRYSVFCGSCSRFLARKFGYRLAGEAFVAGLVHDIGILIIVEYFTKEYLIIKQLVEETGCSLIEVENQVLGNNHSQIGAWFGGKWNLPDKLCNAIRDHHTANDFNRTNNNGKYAANLKFDDIDRPLTALASLSEWFASVLGYKSWTYVGDDEDYYVSGNIASLFNLNDLLDQASEVQLLKQEILDEFENASIFIKLS